MRIPPNTWHGLRVISETNCIIKETISGPYSSESLAWADFAPSENENKSNNSGFKYYEELGSRENSKSNKSRSSSLLRINDNVLLSTNQIPTISKNDCIILRDMADKSLLKRARICLHSSNTDQLQDMLIYLGPECDIDISYHINKDESLVVMQGNGSYNFYDNEGNVCATVNLQNFESMTDETACFARINRFVPHKILPGEDGIMIYETTSGPFDKNDTAYRLKNVKGI